MLHFSRPLKDNEHYFAYEFEFVLPMMWFNIFDNINNSYSIRGIFTYLEFDVPTGENTRVGTSKPHHKICHVKRSGNKLLVRL